MNTWKNDVENVEVKTTIDCLRSIELNLSNICNFRCPFCPQSLGWKTNNPTFMTLDNIFKDKKNIYWILTIKDIFVLLDLVNLH